MTGENHSLDDPGNAENRLVDLLERRAEQLTVEPDLDHLLTTTPHGSTLSTMQPIRADRSRQRWILATAAAVLTMVSLGAVARYRSDAAPDVATSSLIGTAAESGPLERFMAGAATEVNDHDLIVWMHPDASPGNIAAVADLLSTSAAVDHFRYVDTATTYDQFTTHYADQPEIIDLVDADMLPTSFVVGTGTPEELSARLTDQPDVSGIEIG